MIAYSNTALKVSIWIETTQQKFPSKSLCTSRATLGGTIDGANLRRKPFSCNKNDLVFPFVLTIDPHLSKHQITDHL